MCEDYLSDISRAFGAAISAIKVTYNFDHGDEFEDALCTVLRTCLPQKYGVCRGFVVAPDGSEAGDDIIIYEQLVYPSLRPEKKDSLAIKQRIPIEAVYAYIEAKSCIILGVPEDDKRGLPHAIWQASKVASVVSSRPSVPLEQITATTAVSPQILAPRSDGLTLRNPMLTAVVARTVRGTPNGPLLNSAQEVEDAMSEHQSGLAAGVDFVSLGPHFSFVPLKMEGEGGSVYIDPFARFPPEEFVFAAVHSPDRAFGLFFATLMEALQKIELGAFPWRKIISNYIQGSLADRGNS
jgi:hypothetical protein